jgi:hypothetical protein
MSEQEHLQNLYFLVTKDQQAPPKASADAVASGEAGDGEHLHWLLSQERTDDPRRHVGSAQCEGRDADDAALPIAHGTIREHQFAHPMRARLRQPRRPFLLNGVRHISRHTYTDHVNDSLLRALRATRWKELLRRATRRGGQDGHSGMTTAYDRR